MNRQADSPVNKTLEQAWAKTRRIVVKLGTQIVIDENGEPARNRLAGIVRSCAKAWIQGKEILLVSSGSIGLGHLSLNLRDSDSPLTLIEKQAYAAVGQTLLMNLYRDQFANYGISTAQVLLTASDFADRHRYLMLRKTLEKLLDLRTIPIINENDTVSTMELEDDAYARSFGDNDKLSALVASKLDADFLIMLTNVDGIYTENPQRVSTATRIDCIDSFGQLAQVRSAGESTYGRGGMAAKIEAARIASISGVHVLVRSGLEPDPLASLSQPRPDTNGTWIISQRSIPKRRQWIGFASGSNGTIVVNEGAHRALVDSRASLLAIGICSVEGTFRAGQVVSIQDDHGTEIGRGMSSFSADDVRRIAGKRSEDVPSILGRTGPEEVIHRDNLVIFEEHLQDSQEEPESYEDYT